MMHGGFIPVYHIESRFSPPCGGVAYFVRPSTIAGELIRVDDFRLVDGSKPDGKTIPCCGACGIPVHPRRSGRI